METAIKPYIHVLLDTAYYDPATAELHLPPVAPHVDGIAKVVYQQTDSLPGRQRLFLAWHHLQTDPNQNFHSDLWNIQYSDGKISCTQQGKKLTLLHTSDTFSLTDTFILGAGASISYRITQSIHNPDDPLQGSIQLSIQMTFNQDLLKIAEAYYYQRTPHTASPTSLAASIYGTAHQSGTIPQADLHTSETAPSNGFSTIVFHAVGPTGQKAFEASFLRNSSGALISGIVTITSQNEAGEPTCPPLSILTGLLPFLNDLYDNAVNPHGEY